MTTTLSEPLTSIAALLDEEENTEGTDMRIHDALIDLLLDSNSENADPELRKLVKGLSLIELAFLQMQFDICPIHNSHLDICADDMDSDCEELRNRVMN